jgi:hypothetical protein
MRQKHILSFILALIFSSIGFAKVQVAFFEYRTKDGQIYPIEIGGRLYHVAIQYKDKWLNAHPFYGVQLVDDVHQIGQLYSIIEIDREIPNGKFNAELGKKFSLDDPWKNSKTSYCSKLVAQILDISPTKMKSRKGWGISPDDLYGILKADPHNEARSCRGLLL